MVVYELILSDINVNHALYDPSYVYQLGMCTYKYICSCCMPSDINICSYLLLSHHIVVVCEKNTCVSKRY